MEPTGERTVPGIDREQYFFARHEAVYRWIGAQFASEIHGARFVDAGSGEGYGAALLAGCGPSVVLALEYDEQACRHSARAYRHAQVIRANLAQLPLQAGSIDVTVSLQVIEHLWDLPRFLVDLRTVSRPGGLLIASTPNREVFSPGLGRGERPLNPYHVEEFDAVQVDRLLRDAGWTDVRVVGLHHGRRIRSWEADHGSIVLAQVRAMTEGAWPEDLAAFIAQLTAADFAVADATEGAEDLIAIGRAPGQVTAVDRDRHERDRAVP